MLFKNKVIDNRKGTAPSQQSNSRGPLKNP